MKTLNLVYAAFLSDACPVPGSALTCNALRLGDGGDYDDVGALSMGEMEYVDDLADVGALPRNYRSARGRAPAARRGNYGANASRLPYRRLVPQVPGSPAIGLRLQPLGFPTQIFTSTSGTALRALSRPQRPFKGKRLVVDIARTGASATGLVSITAITIGTNNQLVSTDPVGAAAFAATAFDVNLELAACTTALDIAVAYSVTAAPTTTDHIDIATTLFGEAVG